MNSSVGRPRRPSQDSRGFAHNGWPMTAFADFTTLCVELVRTASRLGKRRLVAEFLRTLPADEVASAVAFMTGGPEAVAAVTPRLFVPMLPMLGEITSDFGEVFAAHGGVTALEFKYDGARIQVHSDGQRVGIWSRRLSDVTASLPDVV